MIYVGFLFLIQGGDRRDFKKPSTWYDYWYFTVEVGCFTGETLGLGGSAS